MIIGVAIHFSKGGRYDSQTQAKKGTMKTFFTDAGKNPVTKVVRIKGTKVLRRQTELSIKRRKTVIKKIPSIKANMVANFTSTSEICWPIKPTDRKTTFPVWPAAKVPPRQIKV